MRFCVLWSLCQADAIVREFVAGSTWNPAGRLWSPALPMIRYGTEPADASALAASLRALALILQAMAEQTPRLAFLHPEGSAGALDRRLAALLLPPGRAAPAVALFDTS